MVIKNLIEELEILAELDEQVVREEISAETPIVPVALVTEQERLSEDELLDLLLDYRLANIPERRESSENGILRFEMMERFAEARPTSKEEYIDTFGARLRANTEPDEYEHLDNIFGIIKQAEGLECMV